MVQSGRFLLPSGSLGFLGSLPPVENDIELKELRNKRLMILLQIQDLILSVKKTKKRPLKVKGSGTSVANNEVKYIIKVIRSLENRGILMEGTTRKIVSQ